MRLINADELEVVSITGESDDFARGAAFILEKIDSLPTIEAEPVRHGRWKKRMNERTCSLCKFIYYSNNDEWNYCPNCGAKMDLEGE